jgi:autotransporter-associated beta strand protein
MKKTPQYLRALAISTAALAIAQLASAQTESWTAGGGANQNWSAAANWSANVVPTSLTNVLFTNNAGAAASPGVVDNIVDGGFAGSVASLQFANTNAGGVGFYHTTQIAPGQTLTVGGSLTVGTSTGGGLDSGGACQVNAFITGASATLSMNNPSANLVVNQASGTAGAHLATLNMTNLDTFNANIGRLQLGVANGVNRAEGVLHLAKTNTITLSGSAPQLYMGFNNGNNNGNNNFPILYLGQMNSIFADSITMSADKQGNPASRVFFNPVFTNNNPVAYFRGTNGSSSRVSTWILGNNGGQTTTSSISDCTNDYSFGTLDAMVNTMTLGISEKSGASGSGSGNGTFTFTAGTNNVNTLYLGYGLGNAGTSVGNGTMNVNDAANLVVNNAICLSFWTSPSSSYGAGKLNINGGTVMANTITNGVSSGNNTIADITMNGGTLGITSLLGSIGTVASPLKTITLSNATLQLAISGIQTNVVASSLNLNGTTNYINISSVPATVITYNTQFPLIAYSGSLGGTFNIGLTGLPGTYQGYLSNNTANSTIDLVLTNGPTSISQLAWKGSAGPNWDTSTINWLNGPSPVAYFNGAAVVFDDNAVGTTINIPAIISPASVTFSNSLPYSFSGTGIGGSGGLAKYGSGSVLFTNSGNAFVGDLTINSGSVQFGNGGTSGNIPATGDILDNGNLIINRSGNVTLPNVISGSGTLTKSGTSVLTVTASSDFSGTALVTNGTLLVNGVLSGTLTNAPGTTIGGSGTNSGPVNVAGLLQPSASTGTPGTFTSGALTLSPGATLAFSLSSTDTTAGNGVNDLLSVGGNLGLNNNTISLNIQGVPQAGFTYSLINFPSKTGTFNSTVAGTHFDATLNQSANPITVTLSGSGANLKWDSITNNVWNAAGNTNWLNLGSSSLDVFYQGDNVLFDDSVAGVTNNITIPTGASVSPNAITVSSSSVNYSIAGPGQISGNVSIVKQGSSTLALNGGNSSFSGTATVQGGTLRVGNSSAFGSGSVFVTNSGTLDLNGAGLGEVPVTVSGAGVGGNGAIFNSGADQIHAVNIVKLAGDATLGGTGRWDIRINGPNVASLSSADGLPHNLTKVGSNLIALVTCSIDSTIGDIDVKGGNFAFQLSGTATSSSGWFGSGAAAHTITVESNAMIEFNTLGSAYPLYQNVVLKDGSTILSDAGDNGISGSITLQGNDTFSVTAGSSPWLQISGVISGSGNLLVNGTMPLVLIATNTYTGNTLINAGTLTLSPNPAGGGGSISTSANIILAANTVLDSSQLSDQTFNVASGQTLQGNGTVNGIVVVTPGATLSAGTNSSNTGILTVTNGVTMQGNTLMKLNPVAGTNDVINVIDGAGTVYGGTLTLANVSVGSYAPGNSFKLFNAATNSGLFTSIVPTTPGSGLAWDTNQLSNGILNVVSTGAQQPGITHIALSGTNVIISGTNGQAGAQYHLLTTTNLTVPLLQWTVLPPGTFPAANFSITNPVTPGASQSFYQIRVP